MADTSATAPRSATLFFEMLRIRQKSLMCMGWVIRPPSTVFVTIRLRNPGGGYDGCPTYFSD